MSRSFAPMCLAVLCLLVSCRSDPNTPEYWDKQISDAHRASERVRVYDDLRASPALNHSFLDLLYKQLEAEKKPEVKSAVVRVIAKLKDPGSVQHLADAVDFGAGDTETNRVNREIAAALGQMGGTAAVPTLLRLTKAKDKYVQVEAIQSLGAVRAKDAVDPLLAFVRDDTGEAFVTKVSIEALGNIGDPKAVPDLVKLMFKQHRTGQQFYGESSFALYQIGKPAADALLPVLRGDDKALSSWAKQNKVADAALYAKAEQVLGDLGDSRAQAVLMTRLGFKGSEPALELFVRMKAADALGRLRAKDAAKPIGALASDEEPAARTEFAWALARIGGREAIPALEKSTSVGVWMARKSSIETLGLVGDDREKPLMEKLAKEEPGRTKSDCAQYQDDPGCSAPDALATKRVAVINAQLKRLSAATECKSEGACWLKRLDDADAALRERAAVELGRMGYAAAADGLIKHLADADVVARLASIQAMDWLVDDSPDARKRANDAREAIDKQLVDEHSKTDYVKVNEDLKRLSAKLKRSPAA